MGGYLSGRTSLTTVQTANLADDAVTLAKVTSGTDGELITWDASGDPSAVPVGTATHVLTSNGAGAAPTFQAAGGGILVQEVSSQSGALASGTTLLPDDNSIPQSSEGTEFLTVAITPTNASNILEVTIDALYATATSVNVSFAIFQDATAGALAATAMEPSGTGQNDAHIHFTHRMVAGTASSTTFKLRAGPRSADTMYINGDAGARLFGGVAVSAIRVREYSV